MFSFLYPVFFCWNICFMGELIRPSSSPSLPRLFFSLLFSSVASKRAVPKWCYRKFRNPRMSKVMQVLLIFSSLFPIVKFVELYLFNFFFFTFFITSFSHYSVIHSESRRRFPRHEALRDKVIKKIHTIPESRTQAPPHNWRREAREGASDRVGSAAGTLRHNLLLHFPNVHWREDAPATPSTVGDPTAWTCGMPLRSPSGNGRTHTYLTPPLPPRHASGVHFVPLFNCIHLQKKKADASWPFAYFGKYWSRGILYYYWKL